MHYKYAWKNTTTEDEKETKGTRRHVSTLGFAFAFNIDLSQHKIRSTTPLIWRKMGEEGDGAGGRGEKGQGGEEWEGQDEAHESTRHARTISPNGAKEGLAYQPDKWGPR